MLLEINSKPLAKALRIASKIASKKTHIPATSGVLLEATDTSFSIKTTNLDVSFGAVLDCSISKTGAVAVDAVKFNALINTYTDEDVPLTLSTTKKGLAITCGTSKQVVPSMPTENFPECGLGESFPNSFSTVDFASILKRTAFLVVEVEGKPHLSGINLSVLNNTFRATTTDSLRVSTASYSGTALPSNLNVTIPKLAVAEIVAILPEEDTLYFGASDSRFFLKCGNYSISSIIKAQKFPDISVMFLDGNRISINRAALLKALTRTAILSDQQSLNTEIIFTKSCLVIKVDGLEGSSDQTLTISSQDEFSESFRIKQITDFLSAISSDTVDFIYDRKVGRYNLTEPGSVYNTRYVLFPVKSR